MMRLRALLIAGFALTMGACVPVTPPSPTVQPAPTAAPPTQVAAAQPTPVVVARPIAPPTPASAPTPAFEHVAEHAAANAEPKIAAPAPRGLVTWRDDTLNNDALLISAEDLPTLPSGQVYAAWLGGKGDTLFLGTLAPGKGGALSLAFAASDQANLLADFDQLTISRVSPTETGQPKNDPILAGSLPEQALVHLRHLLVGISATPNRVGYVIGLREQTDELLRHAQFLKEAQAEGNLANEKLHAEHLVNLIEGAEGAHYGDLNGNGKVDNPGDGFGVLENGAQDGYVKGMESHAQLAAAAPDATDEIKLHAGHVQIAGANTHDRAAQIRDKALGLLKARTPSDTRSDVQRVLALAQQTISGLDLNGDELVAPVPGEGGVAVAYQHAQLMAGIPLKKPSAVAPAAANAPLVPATAVPPTVAPTAAHAVPVVPTPTAIVQAAVAQAVNPVKVAIVDNTFNAKSITVPVGTKVVWSHDGQKPHTVTADDNTFATDLLKHGDTFEHVFNQVGTFLYYCELHGGPAGAGMAAQIVVK